MTSAKCDMLQQCKPSLLICRRLWFSPWRQQAQNKAPKAWTLAAMCCPVQPCAARGATATPRCIEKRGTLLTTSTDRAQPPSSGVWPSGVGPPERACQRREVHPEPAFDKGFVCEARCDNGPEGLPSLSKEGGPMTTPMRLKCEQHHHQGCNSRWN